MHDVPRRFGIAGVTARVVLLAACGPVPEDAPAPPPHTLQVTRAPFAYALAPEGATALYEEPLAIARTPPTVPDGHHLTTQS